MDSLFELLFKYRPIVFAKGQLVWQAGPAAWAAVAVVGTAAVFAVRTYRRVGGRADQGVRPVVLLGMRAALLALVLLLLLRPTLVVSTAVPRQNVVGILLDDSESMQIADADSVARGEFLRKTFGPDGSQLVDRLGERFLLRFFRFSRHADRIESAGDLTFGGARSNLSDALDEVRRELTTAPLAGLILATDGSDNSDSSLTSSLLALQARSIPVYTVGLGVEQFSRDIEVTRVDAPRTALRGSGVVVEVTIHQRGYAGRTLPVVVEDGGRILATHDLELPPDDRVTTVRLRVDLPDAGPRVLDVRIPEQTGEAVTRNNRRTIVLGVVEREESVLYIEGEPRFEFGFMRRAVAGDSALRLVGVLRSAEHKYLRLGVSDSLELASGFPSSREELFRYRALVLGSMEASFFTADQLRMIADFVSVRGGGFLALGGRRALGEGGYANTPIADLLPVTITSGQNDPDYVRMVSIKAAPAGLVSPVTQLAADPDSSAQRWAALPPVSSVNRIGGLKAGATALLSGGEKGNEVVLAWQRFGRGKAAVLPIQDSWTWQMHADIPLEDQTHETFWRQVLRWLAEGTPARVATTTTADQVALNEPVTVEAEVFDAAYLAVNDAAVTARVTSPAGVAQDVPMEWIVTRDGRYRARFTADEPGTWAVSAVSVRGEETLVGDPAFVRAGPSDAEYFSAERRTSTLQRIADETGGRFYTPTTVDALAEDILYTESGVTITEEKDLWDMPIIFLFVVVVLGTEWALRRTRGLA